MVSAFNLGQPTQPLEQNKYATPGAMEQAGQESLKVPWTSVVLPTIWDNVETSGDIFKGSDNISALNAKAREQNEERLSVEELQAKYPGVTFNAPMYDATANYIAQRQARLRDVEWIKQHSTVKIPGAMFIPEIGSYLVKSFTDPVEVGFMLATAGLAKGAGIVFPQLTKFSGAGLAHKIAGTAIPDNLILAEMSAASLPLSARIQGRAIYGFAENALQNAAIEPWVAAASRRLGDDYTAANSMMNILVGGLMGSTFHIGGGLVADPFTRLKAQDKLKAAADYIALREAGEDGITASAQNIMPQTTLAARDIVSSRDIKLEQAADGQWRASFTTEQGLLRNYKGVLGRTRGDAIRKLQYTYATVMRDPVLFGQLNSLYGEKIPAKAARKSVNPFEGEGKVQQIRNSNTVSKGGKKFKLQFDSPVDKMFYNIQKILNNPKNSGKAFNQLSAHKETIANYVQWITTNIGDTTEADIRAQARGVYNAVHQQIAENLNSKASTADVRISPFIKMEELDVKPAFLSPEAWAERLHTQKEILLGSDRTAAIKLLEDLYEVDRQMRATRLKQLKAARSDIQKLINVTDAQVHRLTKRELARKSIIDSIKATGASVTEEQLTDLLYMMDVVTGDFAKWVEDNGIEFVSAKDFQAKVEKRLNQVVFSPLKNIRERVYRDNIDRLVYYKSSKELLEQYNLTAFTGSISDTDMDALLHIKTGKYHIQDMLYGKSPELASYAPEVTTREIELLDKLIDNGHFKEDTVLYRGVPQEGANLLDLGNVKPGMTIQSQGYLSTTFMEFPARVFAETATTSDTQFVLEVKMPKGSKGLDVESAIAQNLDNTKYKELLSANSEDELAEFTSNTLTTEEIDRAAFAIGTIEGEILLPRDLALKVLDVKDRNGQRVITVTPDSTLNNIYGTNILRENVDVLFNQVKENNSRLEALQQYELGTPEHQQLATEAFYDGVSLPQEIIDTYPDLRVAQELTKEIPSTWLLQAAQKPSLANRIIGEFTQDISLTEFTNLYGSSFVYALGNGRYTKYPDVAIRETGKAVLYDLGEGFRYRVDFEGPMANMESLVNEVLKWEPTFRDFLSRGPEERALFVRRLFSDAMNLRNKSGETFVQYIDKMNLTNRGKVKKQTEFFRIDVNDGEIIYPLENQPNKPKQLGELSLFKGMTPEQAMDVQPEAIYKALIRDELNKVEDLQQEYIKLKAQQARARKKTVSDSPSSTRNELDTSLETQAKEIKNVKKQIEKAKKIRESKIEKINKKSEDYNQIIKGAVDISTEGKYIVGLFQNADISTLVHETAHIFRRTVLDTELLTQAEHALGVKDGKWTREAEEAFATSFEKYLAEGKAPVAGLEGLFEAFKSWLTQIYIKLTQSPMEQDLSPEIRQVFDQLFSEERVKMAEQAGFKNEDVTKALYDNALTQHKDNLERINSNIRDIENMLKRDIIPDETTFERMKQTKLARIDSQLNMLSVQQELTPEEVKTKMDEISTVVKQAENEYARIADNQFQKNMDLQNNQMEFYENELILDQQGLESYAHTLGLTNEQIQRLLEEGDPSQPELRLSSLEQEAEANDILEGALREFGNCARGEL